MALEDDIRILSGVKLFQDFTDEELRLLAFGAETLHLAAGKLIYREGQPAESAFVLARGRVALFREIDGSRIVVGQAGPGEMLGELALITPTTRLTSAAAADNIDLLRLNRALFRRILDEYPETAALLHARITDDLAEFVERIQSLAPRFSD